jgi:hypothetical protein
MHLSFGALIKESNDYIYPAKAEKKIKYSCPECKKDVLVRKGNKRIHHFAHYKSNSPCEYYNNPGESAIHKEAKLLLKTILNERRKLNIQRYCVKCNDSINVLTDCDLYTNVSNAIIEYSFLFNNSQKKADVALLNDKEIKIIFEICYRNKTYEENRPEPWVEFKAEELINTINKEEQTNTLNLICIRSYKCGNCILNEKYEQKLRAEEFERLRKKKEEQLIQEKKEEEERKIREEEIKKKRELEAKKEEERRLKEWELYIRKIDLEEKMFCKCGLKRLNICKCFNSKYIYNRDYKLNKCLKCGNWEDKCLNTNQHIEVSKQYDDV